MSLHPDTPPAPHTVTLTAPPGAAWGLALPRSLGSTELPRGLCMDHPVYLEWFAQKAQELIPSPFFRFYSNVLSEAAPCTSYVTVQALWIPQG